MLFFTIYNFFKLDHRNYYVYIATPLFFLLINSQLSAAYISTNYKNIFLLKVRFLFPLSPLLPLSPRPVATTEGTSATHWLLLPLSHDPTDSQQSLKKVKSPTRWHLDILHASPKIPEAPHSALLVNGRSLPFLGAMIWGNIYRLLP